MRRLLVLLATALAACRGKGTPVSTVELDVFAGDTDPASGAIVIASDASGRLLGTASADAVGRAQIHAPAGTFVTAVFPASPSTTTPVWLVTAPAPTAGEPLAIHGPVYASGPPTVAGALAVAPLQPLAADVYAIELGCTITMVTRLPASIDVAAPCLGSDTNLDILLLAYRGTPRQVVGYAAGRIAFQGGGTFAPAWSTTAPAVPITLDGVAPALDWVLWADGLPFGAQPIAGSAPLWTGLVVDAATVHATLAQPPAAQVTTLEIAGAPSAIRFAASDFLAPIATSLASPSAGAYAWAPAPAALAADAVDLHLEWTVAGRAVAWDVVQPFAATSATLPALAGDLATLVGPPDATPTALLRYVDAAPPAGWDALVADGLYVEAIAGPSTIAARPTSGELEDTRASGYAP